MSVKQDVGQVYVCARLSAACVCMSALSACALRIPHVPYSSTGVPCKHEARASRKHHADLHAMHAAQIRGYQCAPTAAGALSKGQGLSRTTLALFAKDGRTVSDNKTNDNTSAHRKLLSVLLLLTRAAVSGAISGLSPVVCFACHLKLSAASSCVYQGIWWLLLGAGAAPCSPAPACRMPIS